MADDPPQTTLPREINGRAITWLYVDDREAELRLAANERLIESVGVIQADSQRWRSERTALRLERDRLRAALPRLRDCDWTIGRGDRTDPVRDIARAALEGRDDRPHP